MHKPGRNVLFTFALVIALVASSSQAAVFIVPDDRDMITAADAIVIATATARQSEADQNGRITTVTTFAVEDVLKGSASLLRSIAVREPGGFVDGHGMLIPGVPSYDPGDRVLLFLRSNGDDEWSTWGWDLGRFDIIRKDDGRTIFVRGVDEGGLIGFEASSKESHEERVRSDRFLDFIRATARGESPAVDYFTVDSYRDEIDRQMSEVFASGVSKEPYLIQTSAPGPLRGLRWSVFDSSGSITFRTGGSSGGSANGNAAVDAALSAWSDPNSNVSASRSGTTTDSCLDNDCSQPDDNQNEVIFGVSPSNVPAGESFVVGYTRIHFGGGTHNTTSPAETFYTIASADTVISSSASSFNQTNYDQLLTHELGHSLGFRHSNEPGRSPSSSVAVMKPSISGNYGANLQLWDLDAVQSVYGDGPVCTQVVLNPSTPADASIAYRESKTLSVTVTNGRSPFTYQWFQGTAPSGTPISGATSSSFNTGTLTSTKSYYVEVANSCTSPAVASRTATVMVGSCIGPSIDTQPASSTIESGQSAMLGVSASGSKTLQYQWYTVDASNNASPIGGATNSTYNTGPLTMTMRYKVRVSNDCGAVDSATAAVNVGCTLPEITEQPVGSTINNGETATMTVLATGAETYQWYQVTDTGNLPVGDGTATLSVMPNQTSSYFVEISNACGPVASVTVTVTVVGGCVGPTITSQPTSRTIGIGESTTLSVSALGSEPFSYQWYMGASGDVTNPISGAVSPTYSTGPLAASASFWVRVSNDCGSANSTTATVTAVCRIPRETLISVVPAQVLSAHVYTASWESLAGVSNYEFEESETPDFAAPVATIVSGTSTNLAKLVTTPTRFYYRVRGVADCDSSLKGPYSHTTSIAITLPPDPNSPEPEGVVPFGSGDPVSFDVFIPGDLAVGKQASEVQFTVTPTEPWLTVEPSSGVLPAEGTNVTVTADTTGLPVGSNTGGIQISVTNASGLPVTLAGTTSTVPVSVTLVTPVTPVSATTPSASSVIVPGIIHAKGDLNSQWQSDVRLVSTSSEPTDLDLNYTPAGVTGSANTQSTRLTLTGGATTAINDILKNWYGLGAIPGENVAGSLEIRPRGGTGKNGQATTTLATVASSRTYNKSSEGTFGQFIPGIPYDDFVGRFLPQSTQPATLSLQQVSQSSAYRTNVAIVEAAGQFVEGVITVYSDTGTQLTQIPFNLAPGENRQFNSLLASKGISIANARLSINVTSDTGRVTAYASVVDNQSNDPILVPATKLSETAGTTWTIAGVADFQAGRTDVSWRSDVRILNAGNADVNATLTFFPQDNPGARQSIQLTLRAGQLTVLDDLLETHFGLQDTGGSLEVSTATEANLVVTGRTYTPDLRPGGKGTYGQFIPAATPNTAFGTGDRSMQLLQLEQSDRFRTNFGLAEVTGEPVTVKVTAIAPGALSAPSAILTLQGNEFKQLTNFLRDFVNLGNNVYNARLEIEAVGGEGKFIAYGSVVDNATQDPTYVPGQ